MATVYIAPTAQGSADGTSAANAYAYSSLSSAETDAGSGGTILFTDGSYSSLGDQTWDASGVTYKSLIKQGAIFDGAVADGSTASRLTLDDVTVQDFEFIDYKPTFVNTASTFSGCVLKTSGYIDWSSQGIINGGTSTGNTWTDNTFQAKFDSNDTIIARNLSNFSTFERNSFYLDVTNPTGTLALSGSAPSSQKNCIWASSDNSKIGTVAFASTSTNCCFDNMGSSNTSGGTDNVFADPIFVDPENGDLRLRPSSPCIGAGTAS